MEMNQNNEIAKFLSGMSENDKSPSPITPIPELVEKYLSQREMDLIEINNQRFRISDLEETVATLNIEKAKLKLQLMEQAVITLHQVRNQALSGKARVVKDSKVFTESLKQKYGVKTIGLSFNPETGLIIEDER